MPISVARIRLRLPWLAVPLALWLAHPSILSLEVGGGLAVVGLMVRAWAAGTIVKQRVLTTWGPYAYTRNPLYLGSFLMGLGFGTATGRPLLVVLILVGFWVLYARTIEEEELVLEALYGEEYRRYRDAVPAFLPRLTPYRNGHGAAFQLERYFRHREYQAMLGMIALLAALVADYVW